MTNMWGARSPLIVTEHGRSLLPLSSTNANYAGSTNWDRIWMQAYHLGSKQNKQLQSWDDKHQADRFDSMLDSSFCWSVRLFRSSDFPSPLLLFLVSVSTSIATAFPFFLVLFSEHFWECDFKFPFSEHLWECDFKLAPWANARPQKVHWKGFCPECIYLCSISFALERNSFSQVSHL